MKSVMFSLMDLDFGIWFLFPPSQFETFKFRLFVDTDFQYLYTLENGIRIRVRIRIFGQIRIRDSNPRKNESLTSLIGAKEATVSDACRQRL